MKNAVVFDKETRVVIATVPLDGSGEAALRDDVDIRVEDSDDSGTPDSGAG